MAASSRNELLRLLNLREKTPLEVAYTDPESESQNGTLSRKRTADVLTTATSGTLTQTTANGIDSICSSILNAPTNRETTFETLIKTQIPAATLDPASPVESLTQSPTHAEHKFKKLIHSSALQEKNTVGNHTDDVTHEGTMERTQPPTQLNTRSENLPSVSDSLLSPPSAYEEKREMTIGVLDLVEDGRGAKDHSKRISKNETCDTLSGTGAVDVKDIKHKDTSHVIRNGMRESVDAVPVADGQATDGRRSMRIDANDDICNVESKSVENSVALPANANKRQVIMSEHLVQVDIGSNSINKNRRLIDRALTVSSNAVANNMASLEHDVQLHAPGRSSEPKKLRDATIDRTREGKTNISLGTHGVNGSITMNTVDRDVAMGHVSNRKGRTKKSSSDMIQKLQLVSEQDHEYTCAICAKEGELLCCDTCTAVFHLNCLAPPLSKVPYGLWMCSGCKDESSLFVPRNRLQPDDIMEMLRISEIRRCQEILLLKAKQEELESQGNVLEEEGILLTKAIIELTNQLEKRRNPKNAEITILERPEAYVTPMENKSHITTIDLKPKRSWSRYGGLGQLEQPRARGRPKKYGGTKEKNIADRKSTQVNNSIDSAGVDAELAHQWALLLDALG
eukprot:CFRG0411T1